MAFNDSTNLYHTSKYIVDANGDTPYSTIQAALDEANSAGVPATIVVRPGTYAESLTLYDTIDIRGNIYTGVTITGTHTPPTSGRVTIQDCTLTSATDIFNSAAAGSTDLLLEDCVVNCTNGYTFNLLNWTGTLSIFDSGDISTINGWINNTGGATVVAESSEIGQGTGNSFTVSGNSTMRSANVGCPGTFTGTGTVDTAHCVFLGTITTASSVDTFFANSVIQTGANAAISHGSTGFVQMSSTIINSSASDVIIGTGAGNVNLGNMTFENSSGIISTITQNYLRTTNRASNYIVGPSGNFATVQAALDAANAVGSPATVIVQPGTYTESLTLYDRIDVQGSLDENTVITGVHTPPASGNIIFQNITLTSPTDIFSSVAAGTTTITLELCIIDCTSGYTFDLLNWTGTLNIFECGDISTANGIINNTGGATVEMFASDVGAGASTYTISGGSVKMRATDVLIAGTFGGAASIDASSCVFWDTVTSAGSATVLIGSSIIASGANAAISHGSTNEFRVSELIVNSSNATPIGGAGAGNFTVGSITFEENDAIAGTLTVVGKDLVSGDLTALNRTVNAVTYYGTGGKLGEIGPLTDGQLVVGSTGVAPVAATLTAGIGIGITNAAGSITIDATSGGFTWNEVTGTSQAMSVDNGYIANNAALVTLTLPATAAIGDTIQLTGKGAGGWKVAQNAGQTIYFGNQSTTTGVGGSLASTNQRDTIEFVCVTANNDWNVIDSIGNITVV
jgi:hypothetical protein